MLYTLLNEFYSLTDQEKTKIFPLLETLFVLTGHYTNGDKLKDLWEILLKPPSSNIDRYQIELIVVWAGLRKGTRIHGFLLR